MSDTAANGQTAPAPSEEGPFFALNAQFLKDFSFENPRAPSSLLPQNAPTEVQVGADVRAQQMGDDIYEVVLSLKAEAKTQGEIAFLTELEYGAVVTVRNATRELLEGLLLVETPSLMFPFARAIIANGTREGGFLPLLINPINFAEMRRQNQTTITPTDVA
jgi:preprotein translocase subunit SecB